MLLMGFFFLQKLHRTQIRAYNVVANVGGFASVAQYGISFNELHQKNPLSIITGKLSSIMKYLMYNYLTFF